MAARAPFCRNPFVYRRRPTRTVWIGEGPEGPIGIGGDEPIRVQSMTTTDTRDTQATIEQAARMVEAGCEIVRITAPKVKDAENLGPIRQGLLDRGIRVPIVADIHFLPEAAMAAADHVEKIRINPGNYADRKVFAEHSYSDTEYEAELTRIASRFSPLVTKCRALGRAMRIGTNHGSLSDRIMSHFGDSPQGMVESALEFVRICREHDYHDIILSMKASNPAIMIEANRLLAARLDELEWDYPIHLGVTEAGDGDDGRIKSAVGIGSLLADGIGDTIRVSLTEDPEFEIPACRDILAAALPSGPPLSDPPSAELSAFDPFDYRRRESAECVLGPVVFGATHPPRVEVEIAPDDALDGVLPVVQATGAVGTSAGHDGVELLSLNITSAQAIERARTIRQRIEREGARVALCARIPADPELAQACVGWFDVVEIQTSPDAIDTSTRGLLDTVWSSTGIPSRWRIDDTVDPERYPAIVNAAGAANSAGLHLVSATLVSRTRQLVEALHAQSCASPLTLSCTSRRGGALAAQSTALGSLLCDGIGDALSFRNEGNLSETARLAYNILQGTGRRITKTEFISCPSCGRTKFDLQVTTERIKAKTGHLKDVRIAIMGCIVNGPGEMADADFGYVGAGTKRISLYVGKECVERDIPEGEADGRLIDLIKRHGRWTDTAQQELEHV